MDNIRLLGLNFGEISGLLRIHFVLNDFFHSIINVFDELRNVIIELKE